VKVDSGFAGDYIDMFRNSYLDTGCRCIVSSTAASCSTGMKPTKITAGDFWLTGEISRCVFRGCRFLRFFAMSPGSLRPLEKGQPLEPGELVTLP